MAETNTEPNPNCPICMNGLPQDDSTLWSCAVCHARFHMLCTLQWVLRMLLTNENHNFTCPSCRAPHGINSLPGLENMQANNRADPISQAFRIFTPPLVQRMMNATTDAVSMIQQQQQELNPQGNNEEEDEEEEEEEDEDYRDPSEHITNNIRNIQTVNVYIQH